MQKTVGPLTIHGTASEIDQLVPFARRIRDEMGTLLGNATCEIRPRNQMRVWGYDKNGNPLFAEGSWSTRTRIIALADDLLPRQGLLERTLGHESIHWLDSDSWTRWHHRNLLGYLQPQPETWNDMTINGKFIGYTADPAECSATWVSAAMFAFDKPAYSTLYDRKIAAENFAAVKGIALTVK